MARIWLGYDCILRSKRDERIGGWKINWILGRAECYGKASE
jgi:hypothetical protein